MSVYRTWTDGDLRTCVQAPSGKGGRLIIAHVGSRDTGLEKDADLVFIAKKATGDYHGEMNAEVWLEWLKDKALPKNTGGVLVISRAPYHLVRTAEATPAGSKLRKAELASWLVAHDLVPDD